LQVGAAICYRAATTSSFELSTTARAVRIVGLGLWVAPCRGGVAWRFSIQRHRRWRRHRGVVRDGWRAEP